MTFRLHAVTLALVLGAASVTSMASGSHAGGHEVSAIGKPGKAETCARCAANVSVSYSFSYRAGKDSSR